MSGQHLGPGWEEWCDFHWLHEHAIEESPYEPRRPREVEKEKPSERSKLRQHSNTSYWGTITTISSGNTTGGRNASVRKKEARAVLFVQGESPRVGDPVNLLQERSLPAGQPHGDLDSNSRLQDRKGLHRPREFSQRLLLVDVPKDGGVLGNPIRVCRGTSGDKGDSGNQDDIRDGSECEQHTGLIHSCQCLGFL
ncbi:hypothetical protein CR513_04766, partial [Mucuna pruriens]